MPTQQCVPERAVDRRAGAVGEDPPTPLPRGRAGTWERVFQSAHSKTRLRCSATHAHPIRRFFCFLEARPNPKSAWDRLQPTVGANQYKRVDRGPRPGRPLGGCLSRQVRLVRLSFANAEQPPRAVKDPWGFGFRKVVHPRGRQSARDWVSVRVSLEGWIPCLNFSRSGGLTLCSEDSNAPVTYLTVPDHLLPIPLPSRLFPHHPPTDKLGLQSTSTNGGYIGEDAGRRTDVTRVDRQSPVYFG